MKKIIIAILIFSAIFIHFINVFKNSTEYVLNHKVKKMAKKSLRTLFMGIIAVGLFVFAITNFSLVRKIGFSLISNENTLIIRSIMKAILGTESVYVALGVLLCWTLIVTELSFLFSVIALFVIKKLFYIYFFETEQQFFKVSSHGEEELSPLSYSNRKLIFSFARLRN